MRVRLHIAIVGCDFPMRMSNVAQQIFVVAQQRRHAQMEGAGTKKETGGDEAVLGIVGDGLRRRFSQARDGVIADGAKDAAVIDGGRTKAGINQMMFGFAGNDRVTQFQQQDLQIQ
jgi:hypothetical protein